MQYFSLVTWVTNHILGRGVWSPSLYFGYPSLSDIPPFEILPILKWNFETKSPDSTATVLKPTFLNKDKDSNQGGKETYLALICYQFECGYQVSAILSCSNYRSSHTEVFYKKRCCQKFCKIYRQTPVL